MKILPPAVSPEQAVREFGTTLATVHKKSLAQAVEEFNAGRLAKAVSKDGNRPELSPLYVANTTKWLEEFSGMLPGHLVTDVDKTHFKAFFDGLKNLSPKARNDRRAILRSFLTWCAKQDYLPQSHRLFEAVGLEREKVGDTVTGTYSPEQLATLLQNSEGELRAAIAIQALAGLRRDEMLRLEWTDAFSREGYIEITSSKSKTRSRRLVDMVPALSQILSPFKGKTGLIWTKTRGQYVHEMEKLFQSLPFKPQDNGLRHSFCSYHFALHGNENLTSAQAGNSPAMIHRHYKGLATKSEAEKWFTIATKKNLTLKECKETKAKE